MKSARIIPIMFMTIMLCCLDACSVTDKIDNISFTTDLTQTISVTESSSVTNIFYDYESTMDFSSSTEATKYKEKLKSIEVNKITYKISNFTGASNAKFVGYMAFGDASLSGYSVSADIKNFDLKPASDAGTEFELQFNQTDIEAISQLLKNDKAIKIFVSGTFSQGPVNFTLDAKVEVKIVADAL